MTKRDDQWDEHRCSCDDFGEGRCPIHWRENESQDEVINLRQQLAQAQAEVERFKSTFVGDLVTRQQAEISDLRQQLIHERAMRAKAEFWQAHEFYSCVVVNCQEDKPAVWGGPMSPDAWRPCKDPRHHWTDAQWLAHAGKGEGEKAQVEPDVFEYEGSIYVQQETLGVWLEGIEGEPCLEDVIPAGRSRASIRVWKGEGSD